MNFLKRYAVVGAVSVSTVIGSAFTYYRISEINSALGTSILQRSLSNKDIDRQQEMMNQQSSLRDRVFNILQTFQSLLIRLQVSFHRLYHYEEYQKICQDISKQVISPSIRNYDQQEIFQYQQLIQQCKQKRSFNNRLAQILLKIQTKNIEIKKENKLLLERFYQLQEKLLTDNILCLALQNKEKIHVIYEYFREREKHLRQILLNTQEQVIQGGQRVELQMNEGSYGFRMQYI